MAKVRHPDPDGPNHRFFVDVVLENSNPGAVDKAMWALALLECRQKVLAVESVVKCAMRHEH